MLWHWENGRRKWHTYKCNWGQKVLYTSCSCKLCSCRNNFCYSFYLNQYASRWFDPHLIVEKLSRGRPCILRVSREVFSCFWCEKIQVSCSRVSFSVIGQMMNIWQKRCRGCGVFGLIGFKYEVYHAVYDCVKSRRGWIICF